MFVPGHKLPSIVIFKMKTIPKENFPKGIVMLGNQRDWMNQDVMQMSSENVLNENTPYRLEKNTSAQKSKTCNSIWWVD